MTVHAARILKARDTAAHLVAVYGEVYLPLFERLEEKAQAIESKQSAIERARAIAEQNRAA